MDPSFIYDKRDQMDEELDRREPPLDWDEVPERMSPKEIPLWNRETWEGGE